MRFGKDFDLWPTILGGQWSKFWGGGGGGGAKRYFGPPTQMFGGGGAWPTGPPCSATPGQCEK